MYLCVCVCAVVCLGVFMRADLWGLAMTGAYEIALTPVFNSRHVASPPITFLRELISMRCMQISSDGNHHDYVGLEEGRACSVLSPGEQKLDRSHPLAAP